MSEKSIVLQPILSEKALQLSERRGIYSFVVSLTANKHEILQAVEKVFKTQVAAVNTARMPGKEKRSRGRMYRRPSWKKAMVRLRTGCRLDLLNLE